MHPDRGAPSSIASVDLIFIRAAAGGSMAAVRKWETGVNLTLIHKAGNLFQVPESENVSVCPLPSFPPDTKAHTHTCSTSGTDIKQIFGKRWDGSRLATVGLGRVSMCQPMQSQEPTFQGQVPASRQRSKSQCIARLAVTLD